ncbi:putative short-chain type dehydrogenase [Xylaria bambusicola]|uniref:putative short-chain type dehydrogenase n=1 Tax=Xylaria bambusicola TaxID=326684 RepID=UPI002008A3C0|nr:putative short-chain type dehydrogenase [Xylaria bambusicola]KAI0521309.1 putative short-chain type dehydrogenase [Xylaria bambusicola]
MPPPKGVHNIIEGPGDYDTTSVIHSDTYPAIDSAKSDLSGKAVFISGATRGIGRGISVSFAKAGASMIAIGGRADLSDTSQAMRAAAASVGKPEPKILELKFDVSSREGVDAAAAKIKKVFGRMDVVVNNAGTGLGGGPIPESDPDNWWNTFAVNLKGPYLVMRALTPLMLETGGLSTFVTVSSVGAHLRSPGYSAYQTSKLAVLRLTEFLDAEYSDKGIVAITIHPGNVATDMTRGSNGKVPEELAHIFVDTAELTGDSVVYLSKEKRQWLGGRYVNVTWDLPELMEKKDEIVKGDKLKVQLVV